MIVNTICRQFEDIICCQSDIKGTLRGIRGCLKSLLLSIWQQCCQMIINYTELQFSQGEGNSIQNKLDEVQVT